METQHLVKLPEPEPESRHTLLSKYGIPVQHLDYEYIQGCTNAKELEKIVLILRSNEEGHFPHLTEVAEQRLKELKPKSRMLRKHVEVIRRDALNPQQKDEITTELREFVEKMSEFDNELVSRGQNHFTTQQIRQSKEFREIKEKVRSNRIKSTDYASWDKYDVDSECLKIDLKEEKLKKTTKQKHKGCAKITTHYSTNAEAEFEANREKNKGNEFYRNGEYEAAIEHYTCSIKIKPMPVTYTNRAMANIKIKNYGFAIDDCKAALKLDKGNVKAHIRLAEIYEFLNKFADAIDSIDRALLVEPNSAAVQKIAGRLEKYRVNKKKMRFKVQDDDGWGEIAIPGTSNMSPPFYVVGNGGKGQIFGRKPQLLHLINTESGDEDECTVNHLKHRCSNNVVFGEKKKSIFTRVEISDCNERDINFGSGDNNKNESVVVVEHDEALQFSECCESAKNNETIIHIEQQENLQTRSNCENVDINTPFAFLNAWNSAAKDSSYKEKASVLRAIDFNDLNKVIGCKLDSKMLSDILHCLQLHFQRQEDVEIVKGILSNLTQTTRFSIIKMFMTREDLENFGVLIDFLNENERPLSNDIKKLYM